MRERTTGGVFWENLSCVTNFRSLNLATIDHAPCIYDLNSTSLAKANAFQQIVTDANSIGADVIIVTETGLKTKHADDAFVITDFSFLRKDRLKRRGGAVCAFVRDELRPRLIDVQTTMQGTQDLRVR